MITHEPCQGRVAREDQQHDRRVASPDLEESACGQPAFVAMGPKLVRLSASFALFCLHVLGVLAVFSHFHRRFLACLPGTVGPPENTLVTRIINYIFIDT